MNTIKFIVVIAISVYLAQYIANQIVYGQSNSSLMVDKLIQDTKKDTALQKSYKAELLKRMENNTCLYQYTESSGLQKLGSDSSITQLEDALKKCVLQGKIK